MMILELYRGSGSDTVKLSFPATPEEVDAAYTQLDAISPAGTTRLKDVQSPIPNLCQYLRPADFDSGGDLSRLNRLAGQIDEMDEPKRFAGVLDARPINSLDDILRAASVDKYTMRKDVTCDRALGGWLVEHGYLDCPKALQPYLDYQGIGKEFHASHGGAYRPEGYVVPKAALPKQELALEPFDPDTRDEVLRLELEANGRTFMITFPTSEEYLNEVADYLGLGGFSQAAIKNCVFQDAYLADLVPRECPSVEDYNDLAEELLEMKQTDGELLKFCAVLSVEQPRTLHDALELARDLDNYQRVPTDPDEYLRDHLDQITDICQLREFIDDHLDFDEVGTAMMQDDGVRDTEFGAVIRIGDPFPEEGETQWQFIT